MATKLSLDDVYPNPDQPRKRFDPVSLGELADSILENGLHQPITVRPRGDGYQIVMGERRYRAHLMLREHGEPVETISCHIQDMDDDHTSIAAIAENLQRQDITPMEQARAYQAMLDRGYTAHQLAKRLGLKQTWRITERTALLNLRETYQRLFECGQLTPTQAAELAKLSPDGQDKLVRAINSNQARTAEQVRALASGILGAEQQCAMFANASPPSDDDKHAKSRLERRVETASSVLRQGFKDNEITAVQRVDPSRLGTMADQIALMRRYLAQMETALRTADAERQFAET